LHAILVDFLALGRLELVVLLQEGADDQDGIHRELLVRLAQIPLLFDDKLGHGDCKAACQVIIFSCDQSLAEHQVALLILTVDSGLVLLVDDDSLSAIATICEDYSFRDDFRSLGLFIFWLLPRRLLETFLEFWVYRQRADVAFNCGKCLRHFILGHGVLTEDPQGHSDDEMGPHLAELLADLFEDGSSVLWVDFDYLPDEKDSLKRSESRLAFELKELCHQGRQDCRDSLRVGLGDLVDRLDEKVSVLIRDGGLGSMVFHLAGSCNLAFQECSHFLDVTRRN